MRVLTLGALVLSILPLAAWTTRDISTGPPKCSTADAFGNRTLNSPRGGAPTYIRYCGPASAVVRVDTRHFAISGGHCFQVATSSGRKGLQGIAVGLLSNPPRAPGLGVSFWWSTPLARAGSVTIDDSEIELGRMRIAASGTVRVGKNLSGGTFRLYGRDAFGPTGPRVTGTWTCG
jgi:hypothetical protein